MDKKRLCISEKWGLSLKGKTKIGQFVGEVSLVKMKKALAHWYIDKKELVVRENRR